MILYCDRCGKRVSTGIPDDTIIRAWIECSECSEKPEPTCRWAFDDHHAKWDTACGHGFSFTTGRPNEDGIEWCPYCGHRIEEVTE